MRTHNKRAIPLLRGVLTGWWWSECKDEPGTVRPHAEISVWCPHCRRFHVHGWNPEHGGGEAEHRGAHCYNQSSPLLQTGYFIAPFRKKDPGYAAHVIPPGIRARRPRAGVAVGYRFNTPFGQE